MLKPKRMQDSYVELYLPFTEDPELLEKYIATSGLIRLGKVLEDLDSLAGGSEYPTRSASFLPHATHTHTDLRLPRLLGLQSHTSMPSAVDRAKYPRRSTL